MGSTRPEVRIERLFNRDSEALREVLGAKPRLSAGIAASPGVLAREDLGQLSPERWRVLDQHGDLAPSVGDAVFPASRALFGLVHPFQEMDQEPPDLALQRATVRPPQALDLLDDFREVDLGESAGPQE